MGKQECPLDAEYDSLLTTPGNWTADFWWDYKQDIHKNWDDKYWIEDGKERMSVDPESLFGQLWILHEIMVML